MPRPTREPPIGETFGRWTVIGKGEDHIFPKDNSHSSTWKCRCECGNVRDVNPHSLMIGRSKSCGCLSRELTSVRNRKPNTYIFKDNYVIGIMNNGKQFYFDSEDYDVVSKYTWFTTNGYVATRDKEHYFIYLHRLVMNNPQGLVVDHINHDCFDCRKENLRVCTIKENVSYQKPRASNHVTGVNKRNDYNAWVASICHNREIYRKTFSTEEEAIAWRIEKEKELFGEYSYNQYVKER